MCLKHSVAGHMDSRKHMDKKEEHLLSDAWMWPMKKTVRFARKRQGLPAFPRWGKLLVPAWGECFKSSELAT